MNTLYITRYQGSDSFSGAPGWNTDMTLLVGGIYPLGYITPAGYLSLGFWNYKPEWVTKLVAR